MGSVAEDGIVQQGLGTRQRVRINGPCRRSFLADRVTQPVRQFRLPTIRAIRIIFEQMVAIGC